MTTNRKPKRRISDLDATKAAQAAMRSPMGQRALREGWGRGLYNHVFTWGRAPVELRTIEKLKRAANEFQWDLAEMRKTVNRKNPLEAANLSFMEGAETMERELREQYLEKEPAHA